VVAQTCVIDPRAYAIIFNAHRLEASVVLPRNAIIFNAEQLTQVEPWAKDAWQQYEDFLQPYVVWDYSETNVAHLRAKGGKHVVHCPLGYYPGLSCITPAPVEDIDVLFYGSLNERRKKLLVKLQLARLKVHQVFGVYGAERDELIARSKVILNAHFYPNPIFEIFRCSYLFANRKCVVSENGGGDPALEELAALSTSFVPYEKIVDECVALVRDDARRREIATKGFQKFSKIDQVAAVEQALKETT
jgi:hypothetical protein